MKGEQEPGAVPGKARSGSRKNPRVRVYGSGVSEPSASSSLPSTETFDHAIDSASSDLDLRGRNGDEAESELVLALDGAVAAGLPWLRKLPLLGWLFKVDTQTEEKEELLIFITPKIVKLEQQI